MARLYDGQVLGEKPIEGVVRLASIRPASNNATSPVNREAQKETVAGD